MAPIFPLISVCVCIALAGCGEKDVVLTPEAPVDAATDSCADSGVPQRAVRLGSVARTEDGLVRATYSASGSLVPCELDLTHRADGKLAVVVRTAYPAAQSRDLRQWCVEAEVAADTAGEVVIGEASLPRQSDRVIPAEDATGCVSAPFVGAGGTEIHDAPRRGRRSPE